jgi:hypothetical protein
VVAGVDWWSVRVVAGVEWWSVRVVVRASGGWSEWWLECLVKRKYKLDAMYTRNTEATSLVTSRTCRFT